jgi:hypothetical protein
MVYYWNGSATVSLPSDRSHNPTKLSDVSEIAISSRTPNLSASENETLVVEIEDHVDTVHFDSNGKPIMNFQSVDYLNIHPCKPQYNGPLGAVPLIQSSLMKPNFPMTDEQPVQYRSSAVIVECPPPIHQFSTE